MSLISERVALAREGKNPYVICRLPSGWAVMGDVQFLPGYSILLPDPVVPSLNEVNETGRALYLRDMVLLGDALLKVTGAIRINYEILGNSEPELHAHVFPRYSHESDERRKMPAWFYDWQNAVKYSEDQHGQLRSHLRAALVTEA